MKSLVESLNEAKSYKLDVYGIGKLNVSSNDAMDIVAGFADDADNLAISIEDATEAILAALEDDKVIKSVKRGKFDDIDFSDESIYDETYDDVMTYVTTGDM